VSGFWWFLSGLGAFVALALLSGLTLRVWSGINDKLGGIFNGVRLDNDSKRAIIAAGVASTRRVRSVQIGPWSLLLCTGDIVKGLPPVIHDAVRDGLRQHHGDGLLPGDVSLLRTAGEPPVVNRNRRSDP
jgi:hypothetical protein